MDLKRIVCFLGSKNFFLAIMAIFVVESVWIVLTLNYPGIFDEGWHVAIISYYSHQLSPFVTHQPPTTYALGELTHDPSFLYHYLMSFPYRLVTLLIHNQMWQVIVLRLLNTALFALSLVVFRSVLLKVKTSPQLVNITLLFFVLIPVVPFLAAQVNNDNMLMLFTAISLLLLLRFREYIEHGYVSISTTLSLASVCMIGSLTQYEFLPILAVISGYVIYVLMRMYITDHSAFRYSLKDYRMASATRILFTGLLFLSSLGLFLHTYGMNVVEYHTPTPSCNQVLSTSDCMQYYTFNRNYTDKMNHSPVDKNLVKFTGGWLYRMYEYSFYTALNGPVNPLQVLPLPIPALTAAIIFCVGFYGVILCRKRLFENHPGLMLLLVVSLLYSLILWAYNYADFLDIGVKTGINGRYLFPIIIPVMLLIGLGCDYLLRSHRNMKVILLFIVLVCMLEGGGSITYIISSNSTWWWPRHWAFVMGQTAKDVLKPLVINFKLFW